MEVEERLVGISDEAVAAFEAGDVEAAGELAAVVGLLVVVGLVSGIDGGKGVVVENIGNVKPPGPLVPRLRRPPPPPVNPPGGRFVSSKPTIPGGRLNPDGG